MLCARFSEQAYRFSSWNDLTISDSVFTEGQTDRCFCSQ